MLQEVGRGLYSVGGYFFTRMFTFFTTFAITSSTFSILFYFIAGLKLEVGAFFIFLLMGIFVNICAFIYAITIINSIVQPGLVFALFPVFFLPHLVITFPNLKETSTQQLHT